MFNFFYIKNKNKKNELNIKSNKKNENNITFINGIYKEHNLSNNIEIKIINPNMYIPNIIKTFYNKNYIDKLSNIDLLNYITIKNIVLLQIKKNTKLIKPLFITYETTEQALNTNNTKIFITIEKNTKLKLIETHLNNNNTIKSYNNVIIHIKINNNSKIKHYILNNSNNISSNYLKYNININNNVKYNKTYLSCNGLTTKYNSKIIISGYNSNIKFKGLTAPNKYQTHNIKYKIEHKKPYNKSNCIIRNLTKYKTNTKVFCVIKIYKNSFKTKSNIQIKGILLTRSSVLKYKPQLFIKNKNIICTHSSTIGIFDKSTIWYMQTRGITKNTIIQLLIDSFTHTIIKNIPHSIKNIINFKHMNKND